MSKVLRISDLVELAINEYREKLISEVKSSDCSDDTKFTLITKLENETDHEIILDALLFAINH